MIQITALSGVDPAVKGCGADGWVSIPPSPGGGVDPDEHPGVSIPPSPGGVSIPRGFRSLMEREGFDPAKSSR